jgi:signal transduction histidine kinase
VGDLLSPAERVNILLVDDQPDGLIALQALLEGLGQNLVTARSGREALRHLLAMDFAVVLLDVQMPDMDGFETATLIREREKSRLTPIIFLTAAHGTETHLIRGYEVGAVDYLVKPFQPEVLTSKVSVFVELARHRELVRRQAESESANRMKDEFLATLSHELRTPLNAILGWTQMLLAGTLGKAEAQRALQTIERNARAQNELIKDVLDVSRIISGKLRLELVPLDLRPIVEAAIDTVRPTVDAKGLELEPKFDIATCHVAGDQERIQQIVWNLLTNAIKFTPKGGRVEVRLERAGSSAAVVVSDNGHGIDSDFLPFVFDRFRQSDGSSTRAHGGLGLGLAIVRHLVDLHGGTIKAESPGVGRGATFTARFPIISVLRDTGDGADVDDRARLKEALDTRPLTGVRMVVVDDDRDARELLSAVLAAGGAAAVMTSSVAEALRAVQQTRPHVILSDVEMPDEDGYDLITQLRALAPDEGGDTPAAALTAYARPQDRMKLLKSGFQTHISKPVQPAELITVIASLIRQSERR